MKKVNIYNQIAGRYDKTIALFNSLNHWVFTRNLPSNRQNVLEIGCGSGHLLVLLDKYFEEVCGIDKSRKMIDLAKQKVKHANLVIKNANKLPYEDNFFDFIVSNISFLYLNRSRAIRETTRVLKPGGKLVIAEVIKEKNIVRKRVEKIFLRYLWSIPRMILKYGLRRTIIALRYINSPSWTKITREENHLLLTQEEFKKLYLDLLPGVKFGNANYKVVYLVWQKQ